MFDSDPLFSRSAKAMLPSPIRRMAAYMNKPDVISFGGGMPNPSTFPDEALKGIMGELIDREGPRVFQYGITKGLEELRTLLLDILKTRDIEAGISSVMLTSGSQQGLELLSKVLLDPGDVVLVELPSYTGALASFRNALAEMVGVRQDEHGIVTEDLEEKVRQLKSQGKRIKFLYLIPNFQNPSGITIAMDRRRQALEIATREGFFLMEDDPYGELYFEDTDPAQLKAIRSLPDSAAHLIYLSSFSKVVSPGLRTAFIVAPEEVITMLELCKQAADLCSSSLDQYLIYEYCRQGLYQSHLADVRRFYSDRSRAMLAALEKEMPAGIRWTKPMGGMFVWLTLPEGMDAEALAMEAVQTIKVAFIHGQPFFVDGSGRNTLRLTYAKENDDRIAEGIARLARFLEAGMKRA